jgi:hypothetical protein
MRQRHRSQYRNAREATRKKSMIYRAARDRPGFPSPRAAASGKSSLLEERKTGRKKSLHPEKGPEKGFRL